MEISKFRGPAHSHVQHVEFKALRCSTCICQEEDVTQASQAWTPVILFSKFETSRIAGICQPVGVRAFICLHGPNTSAHAALPPRPGPPAGPQAPSGHAARLLCFIKNFYSLIRCNFQVDLGQSSYLEIETEGSEEVKITVHTM